MMRRIRSSVGAGLDATFSWAKVNGVWRALAIFHARRHPIHGENEFCSTRSRLLPADYGSANTTYAPRPEDFCELAPLPGERIPQVFGVVALTTM